MSQNLTGFRNALQYLRTEVNPEFPITQLVTFLTVAENDGITMPELADLMDSLQGSLSRNIKALSTWLESSRNNPMMSVKRGMGLVETRSDVRERRRLAVWLTPKGREVLKGVQEALQQTKKRR